MNIEVKRFKAEDGREGSYWSMGNGLIKVLFDDGDMAILVEKPCGEESDEQSR